MAALWAWLIRLLGGFNLFKSEKLGKFIYHAIITLIVIAVLACIFWKVFFQRTTTERTIINNPGTVIVQKECPKQPAFSILKLWKLHLLSVE